MKKKLKVMAAALLASALPLSGCTILGVEIPGTESIPNVKIPGADLMKDLLNKVDILDIIPDGDDNNEDDNQGDNNDDGDNTVTKTVTNVTITGAKSIMVGQTLTLTAMVSGDNLSASDKAVSWSSNNESIASVANGVVTAKAVGTAKITATSTLDSTKKAEVTITVKEAAWTATQKAMMQAAIGQEIPFIYGSWTFNDSYLDSYGALILESTDSDAVAKAREAFNGDTANFTYVGMQHDDDYNCDDYYYAGKPSTQFPGYQAFIDIYEIQGQTTIEMYMNYIKYEEWPTQQIASYGAVLGLTNLTLPAYEIEEGYYNAAPEQLTNGGACVFVGVNDGVSYADDYIELFSEDNYYIIYDGTEYLVSPHSKDYTIVVYDSDSGFEILVVDYIPDPYIYINEVYDMVALGTTFELTYEKGVDVLDTDVITFTSSDETIATVDESTGVVTPVAVGSVEITALVNGEEAGGTMLYVVEEIKTAWSQADLDAFANIRTGFTEVPFSKYIDEVEYDAENDVVNASSSLYSYAFEDYIETLEADGWVNMLGEYADLYYYFGAPYMFEKEVVIGEEHFFPTIEVWSVQPYEDEEGEVQQGMGYEGYLNLCIYDAYLYSHAEALTELQTALAGLEIETTAEFPEIPATHYSVFESEDYWTEETYVEFDAYGVGTLTAQQVGALFTEKGWTDVAVEHVEADEEMGVTEHDEITAVSADGALDMLAQLDGSDLYIGYYEAMGGGQEEAGASFDFSELTVTSGEMNGISFTTDKASGQSAPAYNTDKQELRLYAKNTITFTSADEMTEIFFSANTCGESKATATFASASTGSVSTVEGGFLWTGSATTVTLTVSDSGQIHINSIEVNGGGTGSGGGGQTVGLEAFADEVSEAIFGESGVLQYDSSYDEYWCAYLSGQTTMMAACQEICSYLSSYTMYQAPTAGTANDGTDIVDACYGDGEYEIYVMTYEVTQGIVYQIEVYEA